MPLKRQSLISAAIRWPFLPDPVNPSFLPVDRQSGITYPITEEAVINHIFISFHLPLSSLKMSLSLTLKADLLWKQSHIPLFLPGWLVRAGNDCRELRFVPRVQLDEVHRVERNHTSRNTSTHNHWMASRTLRSLSPSSSQPSGLCGPRSTRTIQPSRCCLSGPAANPPWWDKCAEEDWHRSTRLAVRSTDTQALLHMHRFSNFC